MADQIPNYARMFKTMATFQLPKSVKDLLGPTYQHVNTWGGVNECMQKEVANKALVTSQHTAITVLQKLHEFHDKLEAHKASIHRDLEAASRHWRQNPNASSSRTPVKVSSHRQGRAGKAAARKFDDLLPMPGYGDLGPPPTLAPGKSLLDGSLTALEPKIQPFSGMTSESIKGATAPASTMGLGLEKDTSSVALLDEDFVRGGSIPSLKAGIKLASGSANVMVAPVAPAVHSTDEDDLMDDWTVPEEDPMEDWTVLEEDTEMADA